VSTTPNGTRIIAHKADGAEVNITEGVQALYDLVIQSMDWGSGFFTVEDALPVVAIAKTCGFASAEEAERYVDDQRFSTEQRAFIDARQISYSPSSEEPPAHDHIFGSSMRCLWPWCKVTYSRAGGVLK
jgi:hypothetical protein